MATRKTPPTEPTPESGDAATAPESAPAAPERPHVPVEVDASRVSPYPAGPHRGGIVTDSRNRCALCGGVGDHVHTVGGKGGGVEEHVHRDEPEGDD